VIGSDQWGYRTRGAGRNRGARWAKFVDVCSQRATARPPGMSMPGRFFGSPRSVAAGKLKTCAVRTSRRSRRRCWQLPFASFASSCDTVAGECAACVRHARVVHDAIWGQLGEIAHPHPNPGREMGFGLALGWGTRLALGAWIRCASGARGSGDDVSTTEHDGDDADARSGGR
jgi:hypothetical protein